MGGPNTAGDKTTSTGLGIGKWGLIALAVLLIAAAFFLWPRPGGDVENELSDTDGPSPRQVELVRSALASTENLETVEADRVWTALLQQSPQDVSVALNRALNRVLRLDALAAQATNAALDDAEKKAARAQLPEAIAGARAATDDFAALADDPVTPMWLRARIDLHEASLLPGSMTKSLRREVYDRLAAAINGEIGKDPRAMILGGSLIGVLEQMEDPIDGLPAEVRSSAASTLATLSDAHPDNLFFALRAARLNIENKDPRAAQFVRRASELTGAIEPSVRTETQKIGVTPDELVNQIVTAIEQADWTTAENRMLLWFNVLNSTEIVKTDRRRGSPHPLDRLSFESLRRLSEALVQATPVEPGASEIRFAATPIDASDKVELVQTLDFDLDLDPDLVSVDDAGKMTLWNNTGDGNWSAAGNVDLPGTPRGVIVADLFLVDSSDPARLRSDRKASGPDDTGSGVRHDTFVNLIAFGDWGVSVVRVDGRAGDENSAALQLVGQETGLESLTGVTAAVAGDLEADGDLDLVFATADDGVRMFVNRGNRTFFELPDTGLALTRQDPVSALAIADLDRDLDLDVVTTHAASGRIGMLENLLHLQFRARQFDEIEAVPGAASIAVQDVDGNVSWDLIVGGSDAAAVVFSHTADAGVWTVDKVRRSDQAATQMVVVDADNDSWLELFSDAQWSRLQDSGLSDWSTAESLRGVGSLVAADFNRDGAVDLAGHREGDVVVLINQTQPMGHYLDLRFKGIDDNASGRVNHYAIGSVLETRFGPHYRARIVTSPSTHFGIDGFEGASSVRAILPNGLTQTIRDPAIDTLIEEEQTLKGSCPYLYAWDGEKFVFMTDCLWAAPLGLQVAHGVVAKDRPWEYLKLDGTQIQPRDGRYEMRITEELWEVAYFDQIALTAVDHPADVDVWTNEKVGPDNIATPTLFAFRPQDLIPLQQALDTAGRDVTDQLAATDRDFVQGFDRRLRQGLCPPHWIDLDFGDLETQRLDDPNTAVHLVLTGWIMPTDASLNIQIDQNPQLPPIEFPSVWVPDAEAADGWKQVIPFMGFPGGKTKTIVVDLTEVINRDDPRVRVRTSAQIYWDSAQLAVHDDPAEFRTHEVELLSAEVGFHGFSRRIKPGPTEPETYDYGQASVAAAWPPLRGALTNTGECLELLRQWDDRMVVISSGDEIQLSFSVPDQDPPPGWVRDFVLHSVGWDKDADLNTLSGQQIGPLPYRGMPQYPPSAVEPERSAAVEQLNRSTRGRYPSFRAFWHRSSDPPPMNFTDHSLSE